MPSTIPYSLPLLQAAHRGAGPGDELTLVVVVPETARRGDVPRMVSGPVVGIGSRISIVDRRTGRLVEDLRSEWIACATVQPRGQR